MTEEEIKERAKQFGFDPNCMRLYEPFYNKLAEARQYRWRYTCEKECFEWNFLIGQNEDYLIPLYVDEGLHKMQAKLLNGAAH